ncbi:MAG: LPS-assembly protein LptD [Geminicoccaceae bacterium]|nr:MAG: LPS-assembly protein LptD [Geminicoccaceae bacterium]
MRASTTCLVGAAIWLFASSAVAQLLQPPTGAAEGDDEVLLEAESLAYDQATDRAIARGRVFFARGASTLFADEVIYDRAARTVEARGNVVLVDTQGDSYFAERMVLEDDLARGFAESIGARLVDSSMLAARRADREGATTRLTDVAYTPCEVCEERGPTWQLRASTVVHDADERMVTYQNAWLEVRGVPVFYTPYFAHPDGTEGRKSGLLTPTFGFDSELGATLETPYYWVLAPNRDVTIRPTFTTEERAVLAFDLRDLQSFGRTDLTLSGTYASIGLGNDNREDRFRGHVEGTGRYRLGTDWRGDLDLSLATDQTYLRRYGISGANVLTNRASAYRIENDRFVDVAVLGFQNLRADRDQGQVPYALPQLRSEFTGRFDGFGANWRVTPDVLTLYRPDGRDTRRASLQGEVDASRISPLGDVFTARASLRGDVYSVTGDVETGVDDGTTRQTARAMPRASLEWRRPYSRAATDADGLTYTIEPAATAQWAPTGFASSRIPNEDSLDTEFDETNLFATNRFTGLDQWDEGSRITYGVRTAASAPDREIWSVFLGQSYRISETDVFDNVSGLEDQLSDFVGRVGLSPHPWVDLDYRFRVAAGFGDLSKSDLKVVGGPPRFRLGVAHLLLDEERGGLGRREELRGAASFQLTDHWSFIANTRLDLDDNSRILDSYGLSYVDDCLVFVLGVEQNFTRDRDARSSTTVAFRVSFRNLGGFDYGLALPGSAN